MKKVYAYIGTWGSDIQGAGQGNQEVSGGIKIFKMSDEEILIPVGVESPEINAGMLAITQNNKYIYAVNERKDWKGIYGNGGSVCSYSIDADTGMLTKLNEVSSVGAFPCNITVDSEGKYVFIVNHGHHDDIVTRLSRNEIGEIVAEPLYDDGSIAMFKIEDDGSLSSCVDAKSFYGKGASMKTQRSAHPHSVELDPSGEYAIVADKGADKIRVYKIDKAHDRLLEWMEYETVDGFGPRHIVFHPTETLMYINGEVDSTVSVYKFDFAIKNIELLQNLKTIPQPYIPKNPTDHFANNETADIRIHPSGKFLYISNRGHNTIARFQLDVKGLMSFMGYTDTGGEIPRAINFNEKQDELIAVNQRTGNLVFFNLNQLTGDLNPKEQEIIIKNPVCIEYLALPV